MTSSTGTDVHVKHPSSRRIGPEHLARAVDAATMESELAAFKDPKLARGLIESIAKLSPAGGATLMEVCGTIRWPSRATASATSCRKARAWRPVRAVPCA